MFGLLQGFIGNPNKVEQMPTIYENSSLNLMEEGISRKPIPKSNTQSFDMESDPFIDLEVGSPKNTTRKTSKIKKQRRPSFFIEQESQLDTNLPRSLTSSPPLTNDVYNESEEDFLRYEQQTYNNPKKIPTILTNNSPALIEEDRDTYEAQRRDLQLPPYFGGKRTSKKSSRRGKKKGHHTRKKRSRTLRKGRKGKGGGFGDDFVDTFRERQKEKEEKEKNEREQRKRGRPPSLSSLSSMENLDPQLQYLKKTMTADEYFNYKKDLELEKKREFNRKHNLNFLPPEDIRFNEPYPSDGPNAPNIKYMQTEDGVIMIDPTNRQARFRDEMEYENQAMDLGLPENFGGKRRKSKKQKRYSHRKKKSTRKSKR